MTPTIGSPFSVRVGTSEEYKKKTYDPDSLYFLTDTLQILLCGQDYTSRTFDYKGHLSSVSNLPTRDVEEGDVYTVSGNYNIYRYDGTRWTQFLVADSELSTSSTNPVQNKVVKAGLDKKLDKSGGAMTGNLSMSYKSISHLADPVNQSDATHKKYVDDKVSKSITDAFDEKTDSALSTESVGFLPNNVIAQKFAEVDKALDQKIKSGIDIDMKGKSILNLEVGNSEKSAVNKKYVDDRTIVDDKLDKDSTNPVQNKEVYAALGSKLSKNADINMSGKKITGLPDPVSDSDAVPRSYVDKVVTGREFVQVQADWNEVDQSSPSYIKNKPDLSGGGSDSPGFSGSYDDLSDKPTIDDALNEESTNAIQNKVVALKFKEIDEKLKGSSSDPDYEMSDDSVNAVQNRVIKAYVDEKVSEVSNSGGSEGRTTVWTAEGTDYKKDSKFTISEFTTDKFKDTCHFATSISVSTSDGTSEVPIYIISSIYSILETITIKIPFPVFNPITGETTNTTMDVPAPSCVIYSGESRINLGSSLGVHYLRASVKLELKSTQDEEGNTIYSAEGTIVELCDSTSPDFSSSTDCGLYTLSLSGGGVM